MKKLLGTTWTRKKTVLALALVVIIAAIIFIKAATGPAMGTIENSSEVAESTQSDEVLNGKNFTLSYPANYRLEDTGQHAVSVLESYRLVAPPARGGLSRVVAVTIYEAPLGLENTSAYKARKDRPGEYAEETKQVNGYPVAVMTNKETSETIAFMVKGGMVATIAFSGGLTQEGAEQEYEGILNSWRWL